MQAPRSLSKSQVQTLESCYLFLKTLRGVLLSIGNDCLSTTTRAVIHSNIALAVLNESRLAEHLPEIAEWEKHGGAAWVRTNRRKS